MRSTFRALRHRNFQLFIAGQLVSLIGTWMQTVAQSWLIYRLTESPWLLGLAGFAGQAPVFFLATVGGAVADRRQRRAVLIATQTASMVLAFVLAAITLTGHVRVWEIFALAAALGIVNAFDIPTRQSFIVEMVGKEDLGNAIALNSSMFNGARVLGPSVAGFLVATIGEGWCFFVNGVSFLAVIGGLLAIHAPRREIPPLTISPLAHAAEGFRFVAGAGPVRAILLLLAVVSIMGMPYTVLMPVIAQDVLHGGAKELGVLTGASGLGALAGALLLAGRKGVRGLGRWIAAAAATFGAALVLFSLSRSLWLSAALLVPIGGAQMVQMASSNTMLQTMAPDALRGRVIALYAMTFMGMAPLGALLAGALAGHFGAPLTVAVGGAISVVAAVFFASRIPALREQARALVGGPAEG
jgi:MFS family permease